MCSTSWIEPVLRLAGIAAARATLSESIVAATAPPATVRNRRRFTIGMTCHLFPVRPVSYWPARHIVSGTAEPLATPR